MSSGGNDDSLKHWRARQDALPVDFKGDVLQPAEVRFVERFLSAGERLEWIPRSPTMLPTHDFLWLSNGGLPVELKSPKARYSTIRGRILDAVFRASIHGMIKENFLLDIGDQVLPAEVREQLLGYNTGRRLYRIRRLWVMSGGVVDELDLNEK